MNPSGKINFKTAAQIVKASSAGRSRRAIAKMKRPYNADPAWSRGGNGNAAKKKPKMCSRASLKMLKSLALKRKADTKRIPICVTRTVELPSTQTVGIDRSKLLFMIAIGLTPIAKPPLRDTGEPVILMERMDPDVEAEAKVRTKEIIFEIIRNRNSQAKRCRAPNYFSSQPASVHLPYEGGDNVEFVDLVSEGERSSSQSEDEVGGEGYHSKQPFPRNGLRKLSHSYRNRNGRATMDADTSGYRIITSQPRKPVFKQLANNQETKIFQNWKPESMTKLMNLKKSDDECNSPTNGSQSKLLSSLKSIPMSTLTVRNYASSLTAGGSCKSQAHGAQEDASPVPRITKLEYHVNANLITID